VIVVGMLVVVVAGVAGAFALVGADEDRTRPPLAMLRGARAEVGGRLRLFTGAGFGWELKPMLAGAASTAAGAEPSVVPPQIGLALGQTFSLSLPFGLRLGAD